MRPRHPGPWQCARFDPSTCLVDIETLERGIEFPNRGCVLARAYADPDGPGPEAILMSASPELYKALYKLVEVAVQVFAQYPAYSDFDAIPRATALADARAAMNKADGIEVAP